MTGSTSAGSDSKDEGQAGGSAPANESQGEKPPGDMVPKTQLIAALRSAEEKYARENAELRAALQAKAAEAPKPPTKAELQQLVDSGEITQAQAEAALERQTLDKAKREVAAEVNAQTQAQQLAQHVTAELLGYKDLVPQVWEAGSPEREKVAKEFNHLVSLGHDPQSQGTEAAALRAAFGNLETLRASKSTRSGPADTHSETGSGKAASNKGDALDLTPRQKEHYGRLIGQGVYAGWDAVEAELKEATPKRRAR